MSFCRSRFIPVLPRRSAWFSLVFCLTALGHAQITFAPPVNYSAGGLVLKLVTADLNGDSRSDIIAALNDDKLAVLLNKGDGSLNPPLIYPYLARGICAGDFNRDGLVDLALAGNGLQILPGQGDGTFSAPTSYPSSQLTPVGVAAGDFYRDGKLHIAVLSVAWWGYGPTIDVFRNDGTGRFTKAVSLGTGAGGRDAIAADVNRDGFMDLLTANFNVYLDEESSFSVFINVPNGPFAQKADYPAMGMDGGLGVGDINGDGYPDVAYPYWNGGRLFTPQNKGDGTFFPEVLYPHVFDPLPANPPVVNDFDGDGYGDLVVPAGNTINLIRNTGVWNLEVPPARLPNPPVGENPRVISADLNADGRPDLIESNLAVSAVAVRLNTSTQPPKPVTIYAVFPDRGGNTGVVSFRLLGTGLRPGAVVKLVGSGADISASNTAVSSLGTLITGVFDLRGKTTGGRDVVVTNLDGTSARLSQAFTIDQGGEAVLWLDILGRTGVRATRPQPYSIVYGNRGTVDSGPFRIWISFPEFLSWTGPPDRTIASSGRMNGRSYVAYDIQMLETGTAGSIPIALTAGAGDIGKSFRISVRKEVQ